jgi:hypothetical protein
VRSEPVSRCHRSPVHYLLDDLLVTVDSTFLLSGGGEMPLVGEAALLAAPDIILSVTSKLRNLTAVECTWCG